MKEKSSLKKSKRHEEYSKDKHEIDQSDELEDLNGVISQQEKFFSFDELFYIKKTWDLDNRVRDLVLDEMKREDSEEYEIFIKMYQKFLENKNIVYKRIERVIRDGDPKKQVEKDEAILWLDKIYEGPRRGNSIQNSAFIKLL
jgi:hypothetical protein